jgi:hypothetical protein
VVVAAAAVRDKVGLDKVGLDKVGLVKVGLVKVGLEEAAVLSSRTSTRTAMASSPKMKCPPSAGSA